MLNLSKATKTIRQMALGLITLSSLCPTPELLALNEHTTNKLKLPESRLAQAGIGVLAAAALYGCYHWYTSCPPETGDLPHATITKTPTVQPESASDTSALSSAPLNSTPDPDLPKAIERDGCYFNHADEDRWHHMLHALQIFWATKTTWNEYAPADLSPWVQHDPVLPSSRDLNLQWLGHASWLIQINNFNILTDPIFGDLNPILYPRKTPVGIPPAQLPAIDFVIISHNHHDHLDEASLKLLKAQQPIMLVPMGLKSWFTKRGFKHVIENNWWQKNSFSRAGLKIELTFVPAEHWSGRGLLDPHCSLWGGWLIIAGNSIYFAGDTALSPVNCHAIATYAEKQIDYALLPIGPCEPRELMAPSHMGAEEALYAFRYLNAKTLIPMHWGTFRLGPDTIDTPIKRLEAAWQELQLTDSEQLKDRRLVKFKFGQRICFKDADPDPTLG